MIACSLLIACKYRPEFPRFAAQVVPWGTADCVQFLRQCAKNFASNISEADLDCYVKNFEENDVAGSVIFNFSDAKWKELIPSMGFRKFVCQALKTKETTCHQEMRTVFWNTSKQTEVISGGAEQTDRQGYAIKTSDYLFLWNPLPNTPVSDTAENRNQCWSENLSGAQHGLATEILLWISI